MELGKKLNNRFMKHREGNVRLHLCQHLQQGIIPPGYSHPPPTPNPKKPQPHFQGYRL